MYHLGVIVFGIGMIGIAAYKSHFETNNLENIIGGLFRLKYSFLDLFLGIIIFMQAQLIGHRETVKQIRIDKAWNVKEPDNVRDLRISNMAESERKYQERLKAKELVTNGKGSGQLSKLS